MIIIIHRVNKIDQLKGVSQNYGVEIDIRAYGNKLLLTHDPVIEGENYDDLEEYLKNFKHAFILANIKETGIEQRVLDLFQKYNITEFFLLDVEFPFLYQATRKKGFRKIAIRYSEAEPIEYVEAQIVNNVPLVDWVFIDVNTKLPLDEDSVKRLKGFKTCLVCPERWKRPEDIPIYIQKIKDLNFKLDAIMTSEVHSNQWEELNKYYDEKGL